MGILSVSFFLRFLQSFLLLNSRQNNLHTFWFSLPRSVFLFKNNKIDNNQEVRLLEKDKRKRKERRLNKSGFQNKINARVCPLNPIIPFFLICILIYSPTVARLFYITHILNPMPLLVVFSILCLKNASKYLQLD